MSSKKDLKELANRRGEEFLARFNQPNEYAIRLLQGHLYVEEQLEAIVLSAFNDPDCVIAAKLNFWTKLKLAMGVMGRGDPMWGAIEKLNSARNELAHGRDATHLERKIDAFIASIPPREEASIEDAGTRADQMELSIILVSAFVTRRADDRRSLGRV